MLDCYSEWIVEGIIDDMLAHNFVCQEKKCWILVITSMSPQVSSTQQYASGSGWMVGNPAAWLAQSSENRRAQQPT